MKENIFIYNMINKKIKINHFGITNFDEHIPICTYKEYSFKL